MQPPPRTAATNNRRTSRLPRGARRVQLLRAAQDVFVAQGFHAAAMDDIADRAGVSKPVLYQHFPGKRELYLALLEEHVSELAERVVGAVRAYFDFIDAEGEAFRLVFESDLTSEPDVRERVDRVTTECASMIADVIRTDTGLPDEASELLAVSLVGMAQVSARFWLAGGGTISQDDAAALIAGLAWRGIRGYPRADDH